MVLTRSQTNSLPKTKTNHFIECDSDNDSDYNCETDSDSDSDGDSESEHESDRDFIDDSGVPTVGTTRADDYEDVKSALITLETALTSIIQRIGANVLHDLNNPTPADSDSDCDMSDIENDAKEREEMKDDVYTEGKKEIRKRLMDVKEGKEGERENRKKRVKELTRELQALTKANQEKIPNIVKILTSNLSTNDKAKLVNRYHNYKALTVNSEEELEERECINNFIMRNSLTGVSAEMDTPITEIDKLEEELQTAKKSLKIRILTSEMSFENKQVVYAKYMQYINMQAHSSERDHLENWLIGITSIPWNRYAPLPVSSESPAAEITQHLINVKAHLDAKVSFLDHVKEEIIHFVSAAIRNPAGTSRAIAIKGPPGVGKTRLVMEGIAKALGRPFRSISLGGARNANLIRGSSSVWVAAEVGKIVETFRDTQVMNPIIYFDELDKIAEAGHDEISGALTHLIDPTQLTKFTDEFYSGIYFDLSHVLFIFSYNDDNKVNHIVRDRMHKLVVPEPTFSQKVEIARAHLIPEIITNLGFTCADFIISLETIKHLHSKAIVDPNNTGVRNLKRYIEIVFMRINTFLYTQNALHLLYSENPAAFAAISSALGKFVATGAPIVITPELVDYLTVQPSSPTPSYMEWYI